MSTDPLVEPNRVQAAKSLLVALVMIGVAIAAFVLAAYISGAAEGRIPLANLFMCILLCTAGLVLSGMVLHGRGSWREVASIILPALVASVAALRYAFAGVFFVVVAAALVHWTLQWYRRRARSG